MATVTFPFTLTAGQPENVNQLNSNLAALLAGVNLIDLAQMNANSVGTSQLVAGAVTTAKLATNAVTANELADNSVDTAAIVAGNVTKAKLATDALQTFPQLNVAGTRKFQFGTGIFSWGAFGAGVYGTLLVPHGMGSSPVAYGIEIRGNGGSTGVTGTVKTGTDADASNIALYHYNQSGTNLTSSNSNIMWWGLF